jgi:hypothetical protein
VSISELASKAIKQLDALEASLNLNIVVRPNDKNQIRALNRVSDSALGLATSIVNESPASFPAFTGLAGAADYVRAMTPLAARAQTLATHVQNSVQNQRAPAALQTLAIYGVAKNVGRIVESQTMRENVAALKVEVAPKHKVPKPKQTKAEKSAKAAKKSAQDRVNKAVALLAANGIVVPGATTPTPTPPTPVVAVTAPAVAVTPTPPAASPAQPAVNTPSAPAVTGGATPAAN